MSDETAAVQAYEELVHFLVQPLVGEGNYTVKSRAKDGKLELLVDAQPNLRGRLIGRGGRIARSLRTIIQSAAIPTTHTVSFDIVD
jgi:predicted RNA-binding protein YlqC (UPF0109 family)